MTTLQEFIVILALAFNNTTVSLANSPINNVNNRVVRNNHRKYFPPRENIFNYSLLVDGRNFCDQSINNQVKMYAGIRKIATGQEDDYTTVCSLEYHYFKNHYQLISVDLS